MINKLISKTQVSLLEYEGNPSQDYRYGYCRAIQDVLDLEPIPTLGVDEYEKFKADYENRLKADFVAMLTDMLIDVEEIESREQWCDYANDNCISRYDVEDLIQQKINSLKEV